MFIIKGVVYLVIIRIYPNSHANALCGLFNIINEDEEGRYVYRSEIWQALKLDFHK